MSANINRIIPKFQSIEGWLSSSEGLLLYNFATKLLPGSVVVEIGSYQGRSACFIAQALWENKNGHLFSIDPHKEILHRGEKRGRDTSKFLKANIKKHGLEGVTTVLRNYSATVAGRWQKPLDLLNIDGLHEYKAVKQDLRLWLPFLKIGGSVVCHDAFSQEKDVFQAVQEEIFKSKKFRSVGINDSQIFAVRGTPRNALEKYNLRRSIFFITLSAKILHSKSLSSPWKKLIVNRILKTTYLNKEMLSNLLFSKLIFKSSRNK